MFFRCSSARQKNNQDDNIHSYAPVKALRRGFFILKNMITIHLLPEKFDGKGEVKGVTFEKVHQTLKYYIYRRSDYAYELFERKTSKLCIDFEKKIYSESEFKEIYPKSKDFGIWAWTFPNLDMAILRLKTKEE